MLSHRDYVRVELHPSRFTFHSKVFYPEKREFKQIALATAIAVISRSVDVRFVRSNSN